MRAGKPGIAGLVQQCGFTLLAVMLAMVLLALGSAYVVRVLAQQAQHDREEALLRTGLAIQSAIGRYYENSPGTVKRWPRELADLLDDRRFVTLQRYLRKAYSDPMTTDGQWGLVRAQDGGLQGVYSLSEQRPIRIAGFAQHPDFALARSYRDWKFVHIPGSKPSALP